jgi:hypothetical protein
MLRRCIHIYVFYFKPSADLNNLHVSRMRKVLLKYDMNMRKAKYSYYITSCYASGYVIVEVHHSCLYQIQTTSICFNIMTFIC